ncbi:MAG: GMP reductase [Chlamydiae bacterium]|nr:GMP reductase [Chlamydiota bacterium]
MRIEEDIKLDFADVLIKPKRSTLRSRKDVDIQREFTFKWSQSKWKGIPIIASNMDTVGTFSMAKVLAKYEMLTTIHKFASQEEWNDPSLLLDHVMLSIGITDDVRSDMFETMLGKRVKEMQWLCLDVANGYTERFVDYVKIVREQFPEKVIIAGNVVTAEMTEQLILAGADVVKVGIGPGSVCTTRKITGVGYPQLSAVIECSDAAHGVGGHIISDGGCTVPGDVAKAFGGGADFVMLGGMLAGHEEGEGELVTRGEEKFVRFYGMSSDTAMEKFYGEVANYRASEGKTVLVPYRGPVENTIQEILGGLRSACTYAGARRLKDLPKCTTFVRVNRQLNQRFLETE